MSEVTEAIEAAATVELQQKLPRLQDEMLRMEQAQISKVFKALEAKTLSPEQAYYAWLELYNLRSLSRRLNARARVGMAVVERVVNRAEGPKDGGK